MSSPIFIHQNQIFGDFILKFIVYKNKDDKPQQHQKKTVFCHFEVELCYFETFLISGF